MRLGEEEEQGLGWWYRIPEAGGTGSWQNSGASVPAWAGGCHGLAGVSVPEQHMHWLLCSAAWSLAVPSAWSTAQGRQEFRPEQ